MIVAFFGPSGSGKSTLLREVKKNKFFLNKRLILKKEDDFVFLHIAKKVLGNRIFSDYKRVKFFEKRPPTNLVLFSFLVKIFYPFLVYVEFLFEYIYYEVLFKNKILLRERYIYDYYITFKDILKIDIIPMRFFYIFFPKSTFLFFLSIDIETVIKRNKNNVPNKITAQKELHENVLDTYSWIAKSKKIVTVDNTKTLEESVVYINHYIEKYLTLSSVKTLAIIGLDGSGKSTLANKLCDYSNEVNLKCKIVHFYHDNLLYKFLKGIGFFRDETMSLPIESKRKKTTIWALLTWVDSYIQYLYARLFFGRGLIIFDRYFYDYLVSFKYLNIKGISLLKKTIPPIGCAIWISCDPKVAIERKPENTIDFFISGSKSYKKVAQEYNITTLDSTQGNWEKIFEDTLRGLLKNEL